MQGISALWAGQSRFVFMLALVFLSMSLSRYGTRFLARWLALTETSARRISRGVTAAMWLLILVLWIGFRAGG